MTNRTRKAKPKSYVLLGPDEFAKPRGARFPDADAELLVKAAEALHLWPIEVANRDLAKVAADLPAGRLHASGSGLVPYIADELYGEVLSTALADIPGRHERWPPPRKTCRAAGTRLSQAISSSRARRSNAVGTKRS